MIQLKDICDIYDCPHTTAKDEGKGYPLVRTPNVGKGRLILNGIHRVSEDVYNSRNARAIPEEGDLILAREAPVGNVSIIMDGQRVCLGQRVVLIKPKRELVDPHFLTYYLLSAEVQHRLKNHANGAVVAHLNVSDIRNLWVTLPEFEEQVAIGKILRSIDDKIELNRQINDNLEQQVQALYKSWFVDFEPFKDGEFIESELGLIPEGWSIIKVGELPLYISDYVSNGSFASLKENVTLYETPNYAQFIRNTDLKSRQFSVWVDEASYKFLGKSKLTGGEIIISNVGDVGSVHLCPKLRIPMTLGNNVIMIKPIDIVYNYFIYMTFKWFYGRDLIKGITGGSAMPKFNKTDFKSLKLAIPDYSTLSKFNSLVSKLMEQVINLNHSNQRLSQTRDTLLPKLMSGEFKINEIDC